MTTATLQPTPGEPEFEGIPYQTPRGIVRARAFESWLSETETCWRVQIRQPEVQLWEALAIDGTWQPVLDGRWQYVSGLVPFGVHTAPEKHPLAG